MEMRTSDTDGPVVPHAVLSAASHELRGLLGVARGYLRLLDGQLPSDAPGRRSLDQAGAAATRMAELLDELSEYARWVRGETRLVVTAAPLRSLLDTVRDGASTETTIVDIVNGGDVPDRTAVPADAPRLIRALTSLVAAVARARIDESPVTITLGASRDRDGRLVIRIAAAAAAGTVLYERATNIERAGAGLSIALADLVVHRHGGRLAEAWSDSGWVGYDCVLPATHT